MFNMIMGTLRYFDCGCLQADIIDLSQNYAPHIAVTVDPESYVIIAEQSIVLASLNFASAVANFLGVIYAMNLEYPGRYTYEFMQAVLLKLETKKLSPKVLSLRVKLDSMKTRMFA